MSKKDDLVIGIGGDEKDLKRAFNEAKKQVRQLEAQVQKMSREFKKSQSESSKSMKAVADEIRNAIPQVASLVSGFAKLGTVAGAAGLAAKGIKDLALTALNAGQSIDSFNITMNANTCRCSF
jgi:phage-related minor tail protein